MSPTLGKRSRIIFISYSHDSNEHREKVLSLAQRLRQDGLETRLDQYVNGTPKKGWPRWMLDQLDEADFVLVVCTETYYQRFRGHEQPRKGKGVDWEGALITQELYNARSATQKFVPVLFAADQQPFIPEPLRSRTYYLLSSKVGYQDLYDFLLGQAAAKPAAIGKLKVKPRRMERALDFGDFSKHATSQSTAATTSLDEYFSAKPEVLNHLPTEVDLRVPWLSVQDQALVNTGTADAIAGAILFAREKQNLDYTTLPSRLFIYYHQWEMGGLPATDTEGTVADGVKAVIRYGVPPNSLWPYDTSRRFKKPPQEVYDEALKHRVLRAQQVVRNLTEMKACLASRYPFIFTCTMYSSFMTATANQGRVCVPDVNDHVLGRRGVLAMGYSEKDKLLIVRNSWGTDWGDEGYFYLPYQYLLNPDWSADFWIITLVQ